MLLGQGDGNDAAEIDVERLLPALRECVDQLPSRSRELLHRRYAVGENASALARALRASADSVRQALLRIRVAVKECMEKKIDGAWL